MIFDLAAPDAMVNRGEYDVCIAGAGPAGITLALRLAAGGRRVLLLEAGGLDLSRESQDVYRGPNVGRPYFPLDSARLRYLGGSSNHWSGRCRPLDAWDFEPHEHIPDSGWPIAKSALDPHLAEASDILEIPREYADRPVPGAEDSLTRIEFQKRRPPVRFGEKYRDALAASERIDLLLHANLCDIRLHEGADRVADFRCASYTAPDARRAFRAQIFVLALGGIENARMLLNSRAQVAAGIGNARDLVGRYFTEHVHVLGGSYATRAGAWPYDGAKDTFFAPTPAYLARQQIANAALRVGSVPPKSGSPRRDRRGRIPEVKDIVRDYLATFDCDGAPAEAYAGGYVKVACEQVPNRDSRVLLDEATDRFGLRRTRLDWRLSALDRRTVERSVLCLGRYMATRNCGNVRLIEWLRDPDAPVPAVGEDPWLGAAWHHLGTTRMARTPGDGVVDPDCRVFGLANLYIAGSSVFPTGGHANPTLTILQLTLRLSEHLAQSISG